MSDFNLISLAELKWWSFHKGWSNRKHFSIWQAVAWVMKQEGFDDSELDAYKYSITLAEESLLRNFIFHGEVFDHHGRQIPVEERDTSLIEKKGRLFMVRPDYDAYSEGFEKYRGSAIFQFEIPSMIYSILLSQYERWRFGESTPLIVSRDSKELWFENSICGVRFGKRSMEKWKQLPAVKKVENLGTVAKDSKPNKGKKPPRIDLIENHSRVTGILIHAFAKLLPEEFKMKSSGKVNVSALVRFIEANINRNQGDFPKSRSIHDFLNLSYVLAKEDIRDDQQIVVKETSSHEFVAEPIKLEKVNKVIGHKR